MKRRDFLKILSAAPLVAAIPVLAKTDKAATPLYVKATNEPLGAVKLDHQIFMFGESTIEYSTVQNPDSWKSEWGNARHTANGTHIPGDVVVGIDGKMYRTVVKK